jgi:hypothetical protein
MLVDFVENNVCIRLYGFEWAPLTYTHMTTR